MRRTSRRRLILLGIAVLLALLACWCGVLVRHVFALRDDIHRIEARLSGSGDGIDLNMLRDDLATLRSDLAALQASGGPLLSLAPQLGWLPSIGADVQVAPQVLDAALDGLEASHKLLDELAPLWPPRASGDQSALTTLLQDLTQIAPRVREVQAPLQRALERLQAIDVSTLSPTVRAQVQRLTSMLSLMRAAVDLLALAPELGGFDRPQTYLILLQNEDELRPTGGFISAVARVTLDHGAIVDLDVRDSYSVDDYLNKPYDAPPQPLWDIMGSQLWLFRDANWSPDFPTSARKAAELYSYGLDVPVDGVIGLNQRVVRHVVEALGPIEVAPGQSVNGDNLLEFFHQSWAPPKDVADVNQWFATRKDFAGVMANAILAQLQDAPEDVNWIGLGRAMLASLDSRDLLIWLEQPDAAAIVAQQGWDGALRSTTGDYLMIVDSNLGFNKVNTLIDSSATYHVTLNADGSALADLQLQYQHRGVAGEGCQHLIAYTLELIYETLVQTCYWDYVRAVTPAGATLIEATTHPAPAEYFVSGEAWDGRIETTQELRKTVFGTLFVLERGQSLQMQMRYELPAELLTRENDRWIYRLFLQKQLGAPALPVRVVITWPNTLSFISSQPAPNQRDTRSLSLDLLLDTDRSVQVVLKPSP